VVGCCEHGYEHSENKLTWSQIISFSGRTVRGATAAMLGGGGGDVEFERFTVPSVFMRIVFGLIIKRQQTKPQQLTHTRHKHNTRTHALSSALQLCRQH
jgi:hypothetical protein